MNFVYTIIVLSAVSIKSQNVKPLNLISKFGYKSESYKVITADGYILTLYRIKSNSYGDHKKSPCLLIHGFTESALEFLRLKNESLPFILANNGYDVYIGNLRGTKSSSHLRYDRNSSKFWDYSWHEMGIYDLPAIINFILKKSYSEKLFYISSSQGSACFLVLVSLYPEYNQKIVQAHFLGPAVFMKHYANMMARNYGNFFIQGFKTHSMLDLSPIADFWRPIMKRNCFKDRPVGLPLCSLFIYTYFGSNPNGMEADIDAARNYWDYATPYISERQAKHYLQSIYSGNFRQYDYGEKNIRVYGSMTPPDYELNKVLIPIFIYYGGHDKLTDWKVSD